MPGLVKLIEYCVSAVNLWFNPCIGSLPRIKISLLSLLIYTDELIWTPKIITFLPTLPPGKEWYPRVTNPVP